MYGLWIVCLCGVCNFSYFFCENVTYQLWLVCGLVFFSYGCSPPQLIVCWLWGVCLLFKGAWWIDRKSTRLNSSHVSISYAVFCCDRLALCSFPTRRSSDLMYGLWIVCLCGVCNFSYFFCENVTYQLWLVCGLVFFSYGCSPPQLIVCWLWGVCLLFKGAWW